MSFSEIKTTNQLILALNFKKEKKHNCDHLNFPSLSEEAGWSRSHFMLLTNSVSISINNTLLMLVMIMLELLS
jgi:hypothetical protein